MAGSVLAPRLGDVVERAGPRGQHRRRILEPGGREGACDIGTDEADILEAALVEAEEPDLANLVPM